MARKKQADAVDEVVTEAEIVPKKKKKKKKKGKKFLVFIVFVLVVVGVGWFFRTPIKGFLNNATKDIPFLNAFFAETEEVEQVYT